jgi:hypothetical protein
VRPDVAEFVSTLVFFAVIGIVPLAICFWPSRRRDL